MFQPSAQFCLASASPRRRSLLAALGYTFDVQSADIDETPKSADPAKVVADLALEKARAVRSRRNDGLPILAADTVVALPGDRDSGHASDHADNHGEILGKPTGVEDATRMLRAMSDGWHLVLSGVALLAGDTEHHVVTTTRVQMASWSDAQIEAYIASGEPMDKAGAYAIQGVAGAWVTQIQGSYTGVVGLPLVETRALLAQANIHVTPR